MRIVFMGTPEFAVPSLEILLEHGYEVVGVVTATDKYGGRGGKQLLQSAVKKTALKHGLRVLQPPRLKAPEFLDELRSLEAELQVVVAFRMLPEAVWSMPPLGTFNLHASLLPRYRGAAPINWAIINGETETGLTTFFIRHEIDTGDLIFQEKMPIGENETAGELHDRMMVAGAQLVLKTVQAIESGNYELKKQDDSLVSHAPKIYHRDCRIDFERTTVEVHNFIRGLSPWPGAWTIVHFPQEGFQELKILRTEKVAEPHNLPAGTFARRGSHELLIATLDGFVRVLELQPENRRKMDAAAFLNGYAAKLSLQPL
ncbi:MAG: methionyl-tRNA formyltransferase [Saprospiraceae bacterium]|nr:MAG: methionyl-tRNA formyltransferase [Saprospiraceae bacterium]